MAAKSLNFEWPRGVGRECDGPPLIDALLLLKVAAPQIVDLALDELDILRGLLDGGAAVALVLPPDDVVGHLPDAALLLLDLLADFAQPRVEQRVVDELQAARLAHPAFIVALLAKRPPFPVPARPSGLLVVAHGGCGDEEEEVEASMGAVV